MGLSRQEFYQPQAQWFSWYDDDAYACFDLLPVQPSLVAALEQSAAAVWQVLNQAALALRGLGDETLLAYGYPPETWDLIRTTTQPPFLARCDFAVTPDGIYLLECNADVTTFIVETFKINGLVADQFGHQDPNLHSEAILKRELHRYLQTIAADLGKPLSDCHVVFTALANASEDWGTASYLQSRCPNSASLCPIEQLTLDDMGLYDQHQQPIDILYRLYPTDWLVGDRDPQTGESLWQQLEPLLFTKKVELINPISGFVLQNKALLAFIHHYWGRQLHEANDSEITLNPMIERVQQHFLPTFLAAHALPPPYVAKPIYGRAGAEIDLVTAAQSTTYHPAAAYADLPKVYQQYVELPTTRVEQQEYTVQYSCFLVNGIPTGVGARIGDRIIGSTCRFLPLGYADSLSSAQK
jgi:glutathionylspermidine synthase